MAKGIKEVKLRFVEGENEGIEIRLEVPREVVIGRGEDCDIYLGEKKISRRHARMLTAPNELIIEDLKSTNGTFVNGKRIKKERLIDEDTVRIGTSVFKLDFIRGDVSATADQSDSVPSLVSQSVSRATPNSSGYQSFGNIDIEQKMRDAADAVEEDDQDVDEQQSSAAIDISQELESDPSVAVFDEGDSVEEYAATGVKPAKSEQDDIDIDFAAKPAKISDDSKEGPEEQPTVDQNSALKHSEEVSVAKTAELDASDSNEIEIEVEDEQDSSNIEISLSQSPKEESKRVKKKPVSVPKGGKVGLKGNLSEMGLPDLLQTFHSSSKNGLLQIHGDNEGEVVLENGQVIHAALDRSIFGEKALFRMLGWKDAEFEMISVKGGFKPSEEDFGKRMNSSTENLLIEGFRQMDELQKIKKGLPSVNATLVLNPKPPNPLSRLHPRVLDVLQLVLQEGTLSNVMDQSKDPDLDTSKMIYYLIKKQYVVPKT